MADLYLHSLILLRGVVLNLLSTGANLSLLGIMSFVELVSALGFSGTDSYREIHNADVRRLLPTGRSRVARSVIDNLRTSCYETSRNHL
jgi:hypothetical protein